MKSCFQQQDKSYRNAYRRSLSGQIRSYCKKLVASRTNRIVMKNCCQQPDKCIVMPLRRCVIRCRLDKSNRIGKETCMCFTAPLHNHRIFSVQLFRLRFTGVLHLSFPANLFSCAKLKQLLRKYPTMTQRRSETQHVSMSIQSDLSRQHIMTQRRIAATDT